MEIIYIMVKIIDQKKSRKTIQRVDPSGFWGDTGRSGGEIL